MSLDSKFVIASDLQSVFVDKSNGNPLSAGVLTFYKDSARTTPKDVYILNGSPPYSDDSYTNIGSTVTLSQAGTVQYNGNDVILYYFPYDGAPAHGATPATTTGTVELYYVTCYSSGGVLQFTREAWPNTIAPSSSKLEITNYIPNGQFVAHNNIPALGTAAAGQITAIETKIAPGGWYYTVTSVSATDLITYVREDSFTTNPTASPRYVLQFKTTALGSGVTRKLIECRFRDVNKFSSDTQQYTFAFTGKNLAGGSINVGIVVKKYFGTNASSTDPSPSATTYTNVGNKTLTSAFVMNSVDFDFGNNSGDVIGTNNDDYVAICISLDVTALNYIQLTDLVLTPVGTVSEFPQATTAQMMAPSLAGWLPVPDPDGFDLYLPIRLGLEGLEYDSSNIGKIYACTYSSPATGELLCDGSRYKVSDYSSDLIPYERLFNVLYNSTYQTPIFGTGANFATLSVGSGASQMLLSNNTAGSVTATADHGTTFTIGTVHTSSGAGFAMKSYMVGTATFYVQNTTKTAITAATSLVGMAGWGSSPTQVQAGSSLLPEITSLTTPAGSSINAGSAGTNYIKIYTTNTANFYYVWYQVNGAGATDPAPANGTGIKVDVLSTDSAALVAQKTWMAINNWQVTSITTVAASAITNSTYFTFSVTDGTKTNWYVWYNKDSAGTDPAVVGATGIEVAIAASDTAAQVASKTQAAINSVYFAVPDFRGQFLRGWNNSSGNDPDAATRWSMVPGIIGDIIGTFELSANISHAHPPLVPGDVYMMDNGIATGLTSGGINSHPANTTGYQGSSEARPINAYVNYIIKY